MPKRPPMPKPITPDMTDLPRQDSIAACIYTKSKVSVFSSPQRMSRVAVGAGRTALTLGSMGPPGDGVGAVPTGELPGKLMVLLASAFDGMCVS